MHQRNLILKDNIGIGDIFKNYKISIYKAIKSECLEEFKKKTIETTKWSEEEYNNSTKELFDKVKISKLEDVNNDLKKLVAIIHYLRLKNKEPIME